ATSPNGRSIRYHRHTGAAAVDVQHRAVHEPGVVRGEIDHRRPDGIRMAGFSGRRATGHRAREVDGGVELRRSDDAGGNSVDAHALWPELRGPRTGERLERALGRGVQATERSGEPGDPGAEVDDCAA